MAKQAKTLNEQELRRVVDYVATRKHAVRNRCIVLTSFLSGMRVGEIANLKYSDVVTADNKIKTEIYLTADQTKGSEGRRVFINNKLRKEYQKYITDYQPQSPQDKFFYSQKGKSVGFTPNSLAQYFHYLYRSAQIEGASSHSGRRSFATTISSKGVGIKVLQKLLGHKNIQTTSVYIFASDDMLRKAVEVL
ncbi:MAG: site-specific integrase [Betaproteobacteria bacterium]|nr:site-specific integrase [Betaproteobacteria bacterium]